MTRFEATTVQFVAATALPTSPNAKSLFFPVVFRTFVCYDKIKGEDIMTNICTLAPDINQCPHYDQQTQTCIDGPEECGFYKKIVTVKQPEAPRRQKWFEQYIK